MSANAYDEDGIDGPWEKAMGELPASSYSGRCVYIPRGKQDPCGRRATTPAGRCARHDGSRPRKKPAFDLAREKKRISRLIDEHQERHGCYLNDSGRCLIYAALLDAWAVAHHAIEAATLMEAVRRLAGDPS